MSWFRPTDRGKWDDQRRDPRLQPPNNDFVRLMFYGVLAVALFYFTVSMGGH